MKQFVFTKSEIQINGQMLSQFSVGIIENRSKQNAKISFVSLDSFVKLSYDKIEFFNPLKTGDKFSRKVCNICHRLLNVHEFAKNQNIYNRTVRRPSCADCRKIIDGKKAKKSEKNKWQKNKPYMEIFKCPVCQKKTIPGLTSKVVLDHNHKNGTIRGWICESCNTGIGRFKDSEIILKNAISHLQSK